MKTTIRFNKDLATCEMVTLNNENLIMVEGDGIEVSDGYHTISELYEHRHHLFLALVKYYDNYVTPFRCNVACWKSKKHSDDTMFDDMFILGMTVTKPPFEADVPPEKYQITYHLPLKYWDLAHVVELHKAPPWDGHTSRNVLERLLRL